MKDWINFLSTADQWLISYAIGRASIPVNLFSIGHTVELYLKGTFTKLNGDPQKAMNFGHNLKKLWDSLKADPAFMPNYKIRDTIYHSEFPVHHAQNMPHDEWMHFVKNQELYWVMKHLPDLKYIGAPLKQVPKAAAFGMVYPNDYWIDFLKELRTYLEYPRPDRRDWILMFLQDPRTQLSNGFLYLLQLYPEDVQAPILRQKQDIEVKKVMSIIEKILHKLPDKQEP